MTGIFYTQILCAFGLSTSAQDNVLNLSYEVINGTVEISLE